MREQKNQVRSLWKQIRAEITPERRREAEEAADAFFRKLAPRHRYILSYASFSHEFSTLKINRYLCRKKQLLLPRIDKEHIHIHFIDDLELLIPNALGIREPRPEICPEIALSAISAVIVPGLAFDKERHRLGYGKGYYDRLLHQLPASCLFYGLGFKEQISENVLPRAEHDIRLTDLILF